MLAAPQPTTIVVADIRVQFLTPDLVRVERKGPQGFEDRATFTVVARQWSAVKTSTTSRAGITIIKSRTTSVEVDSSKPGLSGVRVIGPNGTTQLTEKLPARQTWLPEPGKQTSSFVLSDSPRLVPPTWGATPAPAGAKWPETNGYDTTNDAPDVYVFTSGNYKTWRKEFLKLTGPIPMVPRFALGFWDSRYHPYTDKEALATIDQYRKRNIPLDLFTVDTDWRVGASHGYQPNLKDFPDMAGFIKAAHDKEVKIMFNDHPEPQTDTALDPKETQYRWDGLTSVFRLGLDVWWFDRNWWTSLHEPMKGIHKEVWGQAVFHDITKRFYPDRRPLLMANIEGINNGIRSSAPDPASHRYPLWWTGDTRGDWRYLKFGVENAVDSGLISLHPYVGEDLGGHIGKISDELYVRFLQYGCLSPTSRVHCTRGEIRYPWAYSAEAERLTRDSVQFRYKLLPTLYEAARTAYEDGTPILRRLDFYYPKQKAAKSNLQYLLGEDILVAPVIESTEPAPRPLTELMTTPEGKPGLKAEYFANQKLEGEPVVTRTDAKVQFNWGQGSPDPKVPSDHFSARWTGKLGPMPRTMEYTFGTNTDDGARLWIDGKLVVDAWKDLYEVVTQGKIRLEQGKTYDIKLEYYDNTGGAVCELGWHGAEGPRKEPYMAPVWVPPGTWVNPYDGQTFVGPQSIKVPAPLSVVPMLVRQGSIIFQSNVEKTTQRQIGGDVTAEIYPSKNEVKRRFYEDDGISNEYQTGANYSRYLSTKQINDEIVINALAGKGTYKGAPKSRTWKLRVHLPAGWDRVVTSVNGKSVTAHIESPRSRGFGISQVFKAVGTNVAIVEIDKLDEHKTASVSVKKG